MLAASQATTASRLCSCRRASCSRMPSGVRMLRPPGGIGKSRGRERGDAIERRVDHRRRFDRVLDAFDSDPDAGVAAQRPAERAIVENLLHAGRRQDRHHHVDEGEFGLMRGGRGFGGMVVAHQREHAAVRRGPGEIGVAEHVAAAVDAGALAVPERRTRRRTCPSPRISACCAPQSAVAASSSLRPGSKWMSFALNSFGQPGELQIEPADRRAAIAGDEAAGVEPGAAVALLLREQQPRDRLGAVQQHRRLGQVEAVGERNRPQGIGGLGAGLLVHHRPPARRRIRVTQRARLRPLSGANLFALTVNCKSWRSAVPPTRRRRSPERGRRLAARGPRRSAFRRRIFPRRSAS